MPTVLMAEVLEDELAILLARVIAVANKCVREAGVNVAESLVTITQISDHALYWRVNYGAKDYVNQRGGDVSVDVDANDVSIKRVFRLQ